MYLNERFMKPNPNLHQEVGKLAKCCYLLTQDRDTNWQTLGVTGWAVGYPPPIGAFKNTLLLPNNVYDQTDR